MDSQPLANPTQGYPPSLQAAQAVWLKRSSIIDLSAKHVFSRESN